MTQTDPAAPFGLPTRLTFHKGRVALYAILKALGIQSGDEVVISGYTCVVVPNAVRYLGAIPVYVDIDRHTYNLSPTLVSEHITDRTRALVIQHTYGIPADVELLCRIAREREIPVIEDCAHTMRSTWKGRPVGSFGDAAFFSSQWSKPITTGMGGWVTTNDPALEQRIFAVRAEFGTCGWAHDVSLATQYLSFQAMRHTRSVWTAQRLYRALGTIGIGAGSEFELETRGGRPNAYELRMSRWQERKLRHQLCRSAAIDEHRQRVTATYDQLLTERGIPPVVPPPETACVLVRYPIRVADKAGVLEVARKRQLEIGDWFNSPIHPKKDAWEECGYRTGSCPNAEDAARHVVNLPTHDLIDTRYAERIVEFIAPHCAMTRA